MRKYFFRDANSVESLGSKKVGELVDESCYEIEEELKEQLEEYLE